MANAIYPKYKEALLTGDSNISLSSGTVKISLVDADTTAYSSLNQFYSDLDANGVITTVSMSNKTVTNGVFDADDVTFTSVSANTSLTDGIGDSLLIWIDTSDENTSRLVAWLDTNISGLPITPDGSNVDITWNSSGIFQL